MGRRGIPTTSELLDAVRGLLADDVLEATSGALRFEARVAANVLGIAARELELGEAWAAAHGERLRALGARSDAELADAIRDGRLDGRRAEVVAALRASTRERLAIENPRYVEAGDA